MLHLLIAMYTLHPLLLNVALALKGCCEAPLPLTVKGVLCMCYIWPMQLHLCCPAGLKEWHQ